MNKRGWLIVGVGVALVAAVLAGVIVPSRGFQKWRHPPTLVLPGAGEVAEMRASLRKTDSFATEEVSEFTVSPEHVPAILRCLGPTRYEPGMRTLPDDHELGQIHIRSKSGDDVCIRFFWFGVNPALLTVNGEDYFSASMDRWLEARGSITDGGPDGGFLLRREVENAFKSTRR